MKRKIKNVRKYALAGVVQPDKLQLPQFNLSGAYQTMTSQILMPKQLNSLVSPMQSNGNTNQGLGAAGNILSGAGEMVDLVGGQSGATTGGEAAKQSVQSVFKGASTGAKMGAALGPVGAVVGGVAGAVVGSIGKSGKVQVNGFYEDPTLTLGTGFKGAVQNKKLRLKYQDEKNRVIGNRFALLNSAQLQQDWAEDYDTDVQTMAVGGQLGSSLAYVDDGEIINTPDGNIMEVPEEGKPTDSNLVNLPEGSRILSDTLKVPGSKETFAQMGKRMMSKKKTKGNDRFAENSAKLNLMNDLMIHDKLFNIQESLKNKNKPKNGILTAKYGDTIEGGNRISAANNLLNTGQWQEGMLPYYLLGSTPSVGTITPVSTGYNTTAGSKVPTVTSTRTKRSKTTTTPQPVENLLDLSNEELARPGAEFITPTTSNKINSYNVPESTNYDIKPSWTDRLGSLATDLTALAPVISNIGSNAETFDTVTNPYSAQIMNSMAGRRMNIDPAKRAIRENRAISNYNASQMNTNTGSNMAYKLQNAVALDKAIADLYAQKSNVDNQYKGDYANTLNNLGQQFVSARNMSSDLNARSRASARNITRAGLAQLGQYFQNKELMRNQKGRDMAMLDLYAPFLEAGYKASDIAKLFKQYKKG